jgi:hypothetical protein
VALYHGFYWETCLVVAEAEVGAVLEEVDLGVAASVAVVLVASAVEAAVAAARVEDGKFIWPKDCADDSFNSYFQ